MRLTNNYDVAHSFFYQIEATFGGNCWYRGNNFYSYGTCIGELTENINGEIVLIVSDNNFSSSTSRHINCLIKANPFYKRYYFPQQMGYDTFYTNGILKMIEKSLRPAKFTRQENRITFIHNFKMLKNMLLIKKFQNHKKEIIQLLKDNVKTYQLINNDAKLKEYKKQELIKQKEFQKKLKAELQNLLNKYNYLDLIKFTYTNFYFDYSAEAYNLQTQAKRNLKQYFNPKNDLSFIWVDDEQVKTSQCITVNLKEVTDLLRLYLKGKLKLGMKISYYTILEIKPNYIKVGCHKIPMENINALIDYLGLRQEQEQAA